MPPPTALDGIRIIDFTHVWQGPLATQLLADFGADVIKIERAGMGDWSRGYGPYAGGLSLPFAGLNRNKRSVVVDPRTPGGKEILLRLIKRADVLVHNFRPGVVERLGLDYENLRKINPRLIHAHSSGWGDTGPYVERRRKGHADMAAAVGGLYRAQGADDVPQPPGISVDYPAGVLLATAILLALFERARSGQGQEVSTDLLSAAVFADIWASAAALNPSLCEQTEQDLAATDASIPRSWRTKDGFLEVSAVFSPDALSDISVALGLDDLSRDPRFNTAQQRLANQPELVSTLAERFTEKSTAEWLETLEPQGVLCAEINTYEQALHDPQLQANNMIVEMEQPGIGELRLLGTPVRASRTPPTRRIPPPGLGEHTEEVLQEIGYSESEIAVFRDACVIP